jgi:hypothetical protein
MLHFLITFSVLALQTLHCSAANAHDFVADDAQTAATLRALSPKAIIYNLNDKCGNSGDPFVIAENDHYFVYQGFVAKASAKNLRNNMDLPGSMYSKNATLGTLRDWISTPEKRYNNFFQINSTSPQEIAFAEAISKRLSELTLYPAANFINYLRQQSMVAEQSNAHPLLHELLIKQMHQRGRPTTQRTSIESELFGRRPIPTSERMAKMQETLRKKHEETNETGTISATAAARVLRLLQVQQHSKSNLVLK